MFAFKWCSSFKQVLKGGNIACAQMGDPNASIPTPQPVYMRPMFASLGKAAASSSIAFVSQRCVNSGTAATYGLGKIEFFKIGLAISYLDTNFSLSYCRQADVCGAQHEISGEERHDSE